MHGQRRGAQRDRAAQVDAVPQRRDQATGRTQTGSCSIGKNVPENMYSGMITNRKTTLSWDGRVTVTDQAAAGRAKASAGQQRDRHEQRRAVRADGAEEPCSRR